MTTKEDATAFRNSWALAAPCESKWHSCWWWRSTRVCETRKDGVACYYRMWKGRIKDKWWCVSLVFIYSFALEMLWVRKPIHSSFSLVLLTLSFQVQCLYFVLTIVTRQYCIGMPYSNSQLAWWLQYTASADPPRTMQEQDMEWTGWLSLPCPRPCPSYRWSETGISSPQLDLPRLALVLIHIINLWEHATPGFLLALFCDITCNWPHL
jgi:hypothetical protein